MIESRRFYIKGDELKLKVEKSFRFSLVDPMTGNIRTYGPWKGNKKLEQSDVEIGDIVWYKDVEWAEPQRGIVSSYPDDPEFLFVRFRSINGERTALNDLSLTKS